MVGFLRKVVIHSFVHVSLSLGFLIPVENSGLSFLKVKQVDETLSKNISQCEFASFWGQS